MTNIAKLRALLDDSESFRTEEEWCDFGLAIRRELPTLLDRLEKSEAENQVWQDAFKLQRAVDVLKEKA